MSFERLGESGQAPRGGVATDAGVDDLVGTLEPLLQLHM